MNAILLLAALSGPTSEPSATTYRVLDFAAIGPAGVDAWDGRRVVLRTQVASLPVVHGRDAYFDCAGPWPNVDDLHRTCWLPAGGTIPIVPILVTGRLRVLRHPPSRDREGRPLPGFVELRLTEGNILQTLRQ